MREFYQANNDTKFLRAEMCSAVRGLTLQFGKVQPNFPSTVRNGKSVLIEEQQLKVHFVQVRSHISKTVQVFL